MIKEQFEVYFSLIDETRKTAYITYELNDILFLVLCCTLCGCNDLEKMIEFAEEREEFFFKYTNMKQIPCLATLTNILDSIETKQLELCLQGILRNVFKQRVKNQEEQICIDGKTICSTATMSNYEKPLHIITALLADSSISIGQIAVDSKSNEIPAVRELIDNLDIKGKTVTLDAMHCQKETVEKIIKKQGDYVIQLKANQGNFYEDVYAMFNKEFMNINEKLNNYEEYQTLEKNSGRIEHRICYVLKDIEFFTDYLSEWKGLKKIFAVKRIVEEKGKKTEETSCYISSKNTSAEKLLSYTRKHWQIESFHWILDVNFDEDECKVKSKNIQISLNIIRKVAISMIKKYIENNKVKRKTISGNMYKCSLNTNYLIDVLEYYCSSQTL